MPVFFSNRFSCIIREGEDLNPLHTKTYKQITPIVLDKELFMQFLDRQVDVYTVKFSQRSLHAVVPKFAEEDGTIITQTMTRRMYFRLVIVSVATALGLVDDLAAAMAGDLKLAGQLQLAANDMYVDQYIGMLSARSDVNVIQQLHDVIFSDAAEAPMFFYAKDGTVDEDGADDFLKPLFEAFDTFMQVAYKIDVTDQDVLPRLKGAEVVNGIYYNKPWMYSGGPAMAGMHMEDSFIHFVNLNVWIVADGAGLSATDANVMSYLQFLSARRWTIVHGLKVSGLADAAIASEVAGKVEEFSEALANRLQYPRKFIHCDIPMYNRNIVSNSAAAFECAESENFVQMPGDAILSQNPHSTTMFSIFSIAFNVALKDSLIDYVTMEYEMAKAFRAKSKDVRAVRGSREFSLSPLLFRNVFLYKTISDNLDELDDMALKIRQAAELVRRNDANEAALHEELVAHMSRHGLNLTDAAFERITDLHSHDPDDCLNMLVCGRRTRTDQDYAFINGCGMPLVTTAYFRMHSFGCAHCARQHLESDVAAKKRVAASLKRVRVDTVQSHG